MTDVIHLINLLSEIALVFPIYRPKTKIQCTIFEDNTSCITVAKATNMTPRTNHIALKNHHFRSVVQREIIDIRYINTKETTPDIFTKPVNKIIYLYLRNKNYSCHARDSLMTQYYTETSLITLLKY